MIFLNEGIVVCFLCSGLVLWLGGWTHQSHYGRGLTPTAVICCLELSGLPEDLLYSDQLEKFLRPSVPILLSSVKMLYDSEACLKYFLVRFTNASDAENLLKRDGERGIRIRACMLEEFEAAVDCSVQPLPSTCRPLRIGGTIHPNSSISPILQTSRRTPQLISLFSSLLLGARIFLNEQKCQKDVRREDESMMSRDSRIYNSSSSRRCSERRSQIPTSGNDDNMRSRHYAGSSSRHQNDRSLCLQSRRRSHRCGDDCRSLRQNDGNLRYFKGRSSGRRDDSSSWRHDEDTSRSNDQRSPRYKCGTHSRLDNVLSPRHKDHVRPRRRNSTSSRSEEDVSSRSRRCASSRGEGYISSRRRQKEGLLRKDSTSSRGEDYRSSRRRENKASRQEDSKSSLRRDGIISQDSGRRSPRLDHGSRRNNEPNSSRYGDGSCSCDGREPSPSSGCALDNGHGPVKPSKMPYAANLCIAGAAGYQKLYDIFSCILSALFITSLFSVNQIDSLDVNVLLGYCALSSSQWGMLTTYGLLEALVTKKPDTGAPVHVPDDGSEKKHCTESSAPFERNLITAVHSSVNDNVCYCELIESRDIVASREAASVLDSVGPTSRNSLADFQTNSMLEPDDVFVSNYGSFGSRRVSSDCRASALDNSRRNEIALNDLQETCAPAAEHISVCSSASGEPEVVFGDNCQENAVLASEADFQVIYPSTEEDTCVCSSKPDKFGNALASCQTSLLSPVVTDIHGAGSDCSGSAATDCKANCAGSLVDPSCSTYGSQGSGNVLADYAAPFTSGSGNMSAPNCESDACANVLADCQFAGACSSTDLRQPSEHDDLTAPRSQEHACGYLEASDSDVEQSLSFDNETLPMAVASHADACYRPRSRGVLLQYGASPFPFQQFTFPHFSMGNRSFSYCGNSGIIDIAVALRTTSASAVEASAEPVNADISLTPDWSLEREDAKYQSTPSDGAYAPRKRTLQFFRMQPPSTIQQRHPVKSRSDSSQCGTSSHSDEHFCSSPGGRGGCVITKWAALQQLYRHGARRTAVRYVSVMVFITVMELRKENALQQKRLFYLVWKGE
ncbi:unnamed protein product [Toxocara canis]|uniref:RRM domain-containing protein n=1 Tax=Toxocara canis TaxID=6265 RepID=A0A183V2R5_TOXCA|nr:unnamed protein product [Toxocara canis]